MPFGVCVVTGGCGAGLGLTGGGCGGVTSPEAFVADDELVEAMVVLSSPPLKMKNRIKATSTTPPPTPAPIQIALRLPGSG